MVIDFLENSNCKTFSKASASLNLFFSLDFNKGEFSKLIL